MVTRRQKRINELLGEELSMLLQGRVEDPRLATVTVTHVETTQDLSTAKVYFTEVDGDEELADELLEALQKTEGFLKTELSGLGLRRVPKLVFARDREYESGQRVLNILAGLDVGEHPLEESEEPLNDDTTEEQGDSDQRSDPA